EAGNRAKQLQAALEKDANKLALDALLAPDLERDVEERPLRPGTVLGVTRTKVYVQLEAPPVELKVYLDDVEGRHERTFRVDESEVVLSDDKGRVCVVGDRVSLRVHGYDEGRGRWQLDLLPAE